MGFIERLTFCESPEVVNAETKLQNIISKHDYIIKDLKDNNI